MGQGLDVIIVEEDPAVCQAGLSWYRTIRKSGKLSALVNNLVTRQIDLAASVKQV